MQSRDRKTASQLISRISILSTRMFEVLRRVTKAPTNPKGIYEVSIHERSGYTPLITAPRIQEQWGVQKSLYGRFIQAMLDEKERCTTDTSEPSLKFHTFPRAHFCRDPRKRSRKKPQIVSLRLRLVTSQYSATRPFSITATLSYNALVGQTCTGMASITSPGSKRPASAVTRPMCSSL